MNDEQAYDLNEPLTWINGHGYDLNLQWQAWNKRP